MPNTPTPVRGDALTVSQVARRWERSHDFVRRMIDEGKLVVDERGLITNSALHDFHRQHGTELD